MKEKIYDARTGLEYVLVDDYYLPALKLLQTRPVGRWGMLHNAYQKLRNPAYYQSLLLSGKLDTVLANVEEQAVERYEVLIEQLSQRESVSEKLKEENPERRWENVMIYLRLFLNFLMIGALSFGGGYGMVSLVRERVLSNGWLTENEFLNFIAVSESTPGPLAVNMATFIGSTQGGILGSFVATLGVVLPSFLIILLIASALKNLMKYAPVNAFLSGVRPCVVAMILATALSMALSTLFGLTDLQAGFAPDLRSIAVFAMLGATHLICKKIRKTAPSPILMILFSAGLGILFWCIF